MASAKGYSIRYGIGMRIPGSCRPRFRQIAAQQLSPEAQGHADRTAFESWVSGINPAQRAGANFWAAERSKSNPTSCLAADKATDLEFVKLGTYNRRSLLYRAFREVGRVERTLFLLRFFSSIEIRRVTRGHILRFGQYALDMVKLPAPLDPQPLPFEQTQ